MARGWESKSVESQQDDASAKKVLKPEKQASPYRAAPKSASRAVVLRIVFPAEAVAVAAVVGIEIVVKGVRHRWRRPLPKQPTVKLSWRPQPLPLPRANREPSARVTSPRNPVVDRPLLTCLSRVKRSSFK